MSGDKILPEFDLRMASALIMIFLQRLTASLRNIWLLCAAASLLVASAVTRAITRSAGSSSEAWLVSEQRTSERCSSVFILIKLSFILSVNVIYGIPQPSNEYL